MEKYYIYKHLNEQGKVVYVGLTKNMKNRQQHHKKYSKHSKFINKIEYSECKNKTSMILYEKYYINKYNPIFNIKDKREDDVSFLKLDELKFENFELNKKVKESKIVDFTKNEYLLLLSYFKDLINNNNFTCVLGNDYFILQVNFENTTKLDLEFIFNYFDETTFENFLIVPREIKFDITTSIGSIDFIFNSGYAEDWKNEVYTKDYKEELNNFLLSKNIDLTNLFKSFKKYNGFRCVWE